MFNHNERAYIEILSKNLDLGPDKTTYLHDGAFHNMMEERTLVVKQFSSI
jgi:hypothetical protein